ncbi:hypothetical protein D3C76_61860 [compost metagenome]
MGRVVTENNKVKFEIENKDDCIMYLGHLIEYILKKRDIYWRLCLEPLRFLAQELANRKDIYLTGDQDVAKFISKNLDTNFNFDLDFYKFKLFNSAINLVKNEMINVIGDFSVDKLAISYNNYVDITNKKNIPDVIHSNSRKKREIIRFFNTQRNYLFHFSSDKLCEWVSFREEQVKKNDNAKFEFGKEFNIYVSETVPFNIFRQKSQLMLYSIKN